MRACNRLRQIGLTTLAIIVTLSIIAGCFLKISEVEDEDPWLTEARRQMVERDLMGRNITDERVLNVMGVIPRHLFVENRLREEAYGDFALPIEEGQTISQPYVVALMTESLKLKETDKVLEVGTGSGYQAAVLGKLVDQVYTIEIREGLAREGEQLLTDLGFSNVHVKCGDGYFGWEEHAPYDAIIVTCAVNHVPPHLIDQLKEGGRLIIPLGSLFYYQTLTLFEKKNDSLDSKYITSVIFVPMTGEAEKH